MPRFIMSMLLCCFLFVGCAKGPAHTVAREAGVRTAKAVALEAWLARFAEQTPTVKGLAWLDLSDGTEERLTDAAVVVARPASVRVDAMDALADVWAKAGSDGSLVWLYLPARDKLYQGRASRGNLRRLIGFEWEMGEIAAVVAGSPPLSSGVALEQVGAARENHFATRDGGVHLWTDSKTNRPAKWALYGDGGGVLDTMVTFGDWRKVGGVDFPHRIEATFPERRARIIVVYRDVTLGGPVDRGTFLAPARGRKGRTVELKE